MLDNAVSSPGKMGWGERTMLENQRFKAEALSFESAINAFPDAFAEDTEPDYNEKRFQILKDLMGADGIDDGFSTMHLEKAVFNTYLEWLAQIIGSCVGSGGGRVCTHRTLVEIFLLNEPETLLGTSLVGTNNVCPFIPYNYRTGRMIGGLNGGDGSFCGAHIEGLLKYGMIPCSTPGIVSDAFPEPQNARTYRQLGNSNDFVNQFKDVGVKYLMTSSVKIADADQGKEVITKLFQPAMICSMWAFEPDYKHPTWKLADGTPVWIYKRNRRTSWAHNMSIVAIIRVGNDWFVMVKNSWGPRAHRNGHWFVIPFSLYADWCRSAEQASIGNLTLVKNEPVA